MSQFSLFVDRQSRRLDQAIVRDATNVRPVSFPELVIGSSREFRLTILDGTNGVDAISGSATVQPIVSIGDTCAKPTGGTWTFTRGANTTAALAYNIDAAALETAIEALASVGAGNVSVKALPGNAYRIEYISGLADTAITDASSDGDLLTPTSTATLSRVTEGGSGNNEVQIIRLKQVPFVLQASWTSDGTGWTAVLSTGSWEALTELAASAPITATLQVTVVLADGTTEKLALQAAKILCDVSDPSQFVPAQFPTYLTAAQVNAFFADPSTNTSFDAASWRVDLGLPSSIPANGTFLVSDGANWVGVSPATSSNTSVAYIETGGNDTTAIVNSPLRPFVGVEAAIDALITAQSAESSKNGVLVFGQGTHAITSPIDLSSKTLISLGFHLTYNSRLRADASLTDHAITTSASAGYRFYGYGSIENQNATYAFLNAKNLWTTFDINLIAAEAGGNFVNASAQRSVFVFNFNYSAGALDNNSIEVASGSSLIYRPENGTTQTGCEVVVNGLHQIGNSASHPDTNFLNSEATSGLGSNSSVWLNNCIYKTNSVFIKASHATALAKLRFSNCQIENEAGGSYTFVSGSPNLELYGANVFKTDIVGETWNSKSTYGLVNTTGADFLALQTEGVLRF